MSYLVSSRCSHHTGRVTLAFICVRLQVPLGTKDEAGKTARDYASARKHDKVVAFLDNPKVRSVEKWASFLSFGGTVQPGLLTDVAAGAAELNGRCERLQTSGYKSLRGTSLCVVVGRDMVLLAATHSHGALLFGMNSFYPRLARAARAGDENGKDWREKGAGVEKVPRKGSVRKLSNLAKRRQLGYRKNILVFENGSDMYRPKLNL
eukprot:6187422-Pleurochrysis_carterae.AAC.2